MNYGTPTKSVSNNLMFFDNDNAPMRFTYSPDGVACNWCDWGEPGTFSIEISQAILTHLRNEHNADVYSLGKVIN